MIEVNNRSGLSLHLNVFKNFLQRAVRKLKIEKSISLAFIDRRTISRLNKIYRRHGRPTDVLSFTGEQNYLGEIIICLPLAKEQARQAKHSLEKEIKVLLVHGLFHLLGYDHQKNKEAQLMHKKESQLLGLLEK
jgi:probable rRNA maturation factor